LCVSLQNKIDSLGNWYIEYTGYNLYPVYILLFLFK
jgi:hypothetical protein